MDTYSGEFEEPSSLHLYAYCGNNPINYTDPSGQRQLKDIMLSSNGRNIKEDILEIRMEKLLELFKLIFKGQVGIIAQNS